MDDIKFYIRIACCITFVFNSVSINKRNGKEVSNSKKKNTLKLSAIQSIVSDYLLEFQKLQVAIWRSFATTNMPFRTHKKENNSYTYIAYGC